MRGPIRWRLQFSAEVSMWIPLADAGPSGLVAAVATADLQDLGAPKLPIALARAGTLHVRRSLRINAIITQ